MTVLVTGGCGLIGEAFVRALAERGDHVVVADVDDQRGDKLVSDLGQDQVTYHSCDVTNPPAFEHMFRETHGSHPAIDAVVHSAYPRTSSWGTPFGDLDEKDVAKNLRLQLGSAIMVSQQAVKHFQGQGHGHLVHISSIQGIAAPKFEHYEGTDMTSPIEYTAAKSGVIGITRYLAKYLFDSGIRVNCISPGGLEAGQPQRFVEQYRSDCGSKGMLDPEDLTGALLFLLSETSKHVNGQNIIVDDGWSL